MRYWFDASHYKEGGPVIILSGGETGGDGGIPVSTLKGKEMQTDLVDSRSQNVYHTSRRVF